MKKYLSSYKIWDNSKRLFEMFWENKKIAFISNSRDMYTDSSERMKREQVDIDELLSIQLSVEKLDLKDYFWRKVELEEKLEEFGWVYVVGGNTFVLRQAYKLSWFDEILVEYEDNNSSFVYAWYSAGICVLSSSLEWYDLVDDPDMYPYDDLEKTIWEGLWILNYSISPHYDSDHPESADVEKVIQYCIENKILFKVLRDGEVLIYN